MVWIETLCSFVDLASGERLEQPFYAAGAAEMQRAQRDPGRETDAADRSATPMQALYARY